MSSSRFVAYDSLLAVENSDAYLNLVLPKAIDRARLATADAAFATELAYGSSRNQGFYDYIIEKTSGRSVSDIDRDVLCALRLGVHQLLILETPAHAAIFETVELVKKKIRQSASGFANAVLRKVSAKSFEQWLKVLDTENFAEDEALSIRFSHPIWVTRAIRLALRSDSAESELATALNANNINPKVSLVLLPGRDHREISQARGPASPIGITLTEGDPSKFPGVMKGSARVQDQGSQLVTLALAQILPVRPREQWLDLCAGPGGKAALLGALAAELDCTFTTNEIAPHRAKLVATALRHSGIPATQLSGDGRELPKALKFDRIMLDAPCTGLGALRRRPESRWRKGEGNLKELARLQRELLEASWQHLKPGGVLAYVTCSPHPSETTAQVEWFLRINKTALLLDATKVLKTINPVLELNENRKTAQLWPHRNQTDAMFLALIQKPND